MTKATITRKMIEDAAALGLPANAAAEATGINVNTLRSKATKFGIRFPRDVLGRAPGVSDETLRKLDNEGYTVLQAAKHLGYSEGYIRRRASEAGVQMGKKEQAASLDIRPARPPKKPVTIATAMAKLAQQENRAMRERCFNK